MVNYSQWSCNRTRGQHEFHQRQMSDRTVAITWRWIHDVYRISFPTWSLPAVPFYPSPSSFPLGMNVDSRMLIEKAYTSKFNV